MAILHALMCRWNTSMSLQRSLSASRIANCWLRCAVLLIYLFYLPLIHRLAHWSKSDFFSHRHLLFCLIQDMWKPFVHNFWGTHPMSTDKRAPCFWACFCDQNDYQPVSIAPLSRADPSKCRPIHSECRQRRHCPTPFAEFRSKRANTKTSLSDLKQLVCILIRSLKVSHVSWI